MVKMPSGSLAGKVFQLHPACGRLLVQGSLSQTQVIVVYFTASKMQQHSPPGLSHYPRSSEKAFICLATATKLFFPRLFTSPLCSSDKRFPAV